MFKYDISPSLINKLRKIGKKDPILSKAFKKKIFEIIKHNDKSINTYKNLKHPQHEYKRIHLTKNFILIFKVEKENNLIIFSEITHRDKVYDES